MGKKLRSAREWAVLTFLIWLAGMLPGCIMPAMAAAPEIGTVSADNPAIGRYEKFDLSFSVRTAAANLQLPYDPSVPPYAANLKPDEDARRGVSVDGLFLPPGKTDWSVARVQPGFLYRDYNFTPTDPHLSHLTDNLVWSGRPDVWKVRFAPTMLGRWQYRVRVVDADGAALSEPKTFDCTPSMSKGYVRVSPTDSRYFQFDNGDPIDLIGMNLFYNGRQDAETQLGQIGVTGASLLLRLWIAGRSGQEIIGGFANSSGGRWWQFTGSTQLIDTDAHSGRFCLSVPSDNEATTREVPLKPDTNYRVEAWVKPEGASTLVVATEDSDTYANHRETTVTLSGSEWMPVGVPIPAHDPPSGEDFFGTVKFQPHGGGKMLLDDVKIVNTANGNDALEVGDFERHVQYDQRQSWVLDRVVEDAARLGQYFRFNCLENDDSVFCNIGPDGLPAPHDHKNFWGASTDANADLPVRRFQRYYARYLIARWGYSTAIAQWEYNNEGAPFNGFHYAAAENFARAIHAERAEGRRPCGTSFYQNASGTSYAGDFYDSGLYPDIDYADVHYYPSSGVPGSSYTPYSEVYGGFERLPREGPDGLGAAHLDPVKSAGKEQHTLLAFSKIRGRGKWTISYRVRAGAGAKLDWFGRGPDLEFWSDSLHLNALTVPNHPGSPTLPPDYDWRTYSASFTAADDKVHDAHLWLYAVGLKGGPVDFSDVKVRAPDRRLWAHYTFDEPSMEHDTAAMAEYLGLTYTSLSGDPAIGKPLSIGEADIVGPDGNYDTQIEQDKTGVYMRQFCWAHLNPSGAIVFLYTNAGGEATRRGYWKYAAAYQRFLAGVQLTNGRYRNIDAAVSAPNMIVIGQKDTAAGRAHFFVYNRGGNWYNLTMNPGAVTAISGTVAIPGMPDGSYAVEEYDTSTGKVRRTEILVTSGGELRIPVERLASDEAFKAAVQAKASPTRQ